ncbi:relA-associated inhibitor isoform X3 [Gopherus evgoodei]|uniref:relA-associated inhibitor isoform X3 n=1 Tax=Gopherus evgoodei TaxID=1825980 RepID=UPI0011CF3EA0|nr:relA-associated inhibitor isoform X3 [Gopherus evgoodei]
MAALAMKHIDLKQAELDTAVAKVDELSKQLETLWTDSSGQTAGQPKVDRYGASPSHAPEPLRLATSPQLQYARKNLSLESTDSFISYYAETFSPTAACSPPAKAHPASPQSPFYLQGEPLERAQSPRPKVLPVSYDSLPLPSPKGRAPSPRSLWQAGATERLSFSRPVGRAGSPRLVPTPSEASAPQMFFPDRAMSPRPPHPPPYESHSLFPTGPSSFAPFRAQDDLVIRRRPQRSWNESDLDVAYEKKSSHSAGYERSDLHAGLRQAPAGLQLAPWRESSLDGAAGQGKDERPQPYAIHSATLPRNYKVSLLPGERRPDSSFRRLLPATQTGTLPRNWQFSQQPVSRIAMPPPSPHGTRATRHKPLPLSMIFKLQNAFWASGASSAKGQPQGAPGSPIFLRSPQKQTQLQQPSSPAQAPLRQAPSGTEATGRASALEAPVEPVRGAPAGGDTEPELESILRGSEAAEAEEVARPLSPTRLQPVLPPEAQKVPEFEEVARVLAEIPRPLKRRGSMEQSPGPVLPPAHKKQYQQLISRLFHHRGRKEDAVSAGDDLPLITETAELKAATPVSPAPAPVPQSPPAPTASPQLAVTESPGTSTPSPDTPVPSPVSAPRSCQPDTSPSPGTPTPSPVSAPWSCQPDTPPSPDTPVPSPEKRSALRKLSSPRRRLGKRVQLNPLVLLLDAALTGELDVVQQAVNELNDPSQPNDEGITALHNAICGANHNIVDFLIAVGANVNSMDSHGWTPLHCAASCNDTAICMALIRHGAAIFTTTFSDGSMALEKCDPYREGYSECFNYLADVEQNMGLLNNGVVYALWDYSAEFRDELSFREGEPVTVLRRDSQEELDWWWASLYGQEGYVPKNYFGLFPRVRPQRKKV